MNILVLLEFLATLFFICDMFSVDFNFQKRARVLCLYA